MSVAVVIPVYNGAAFVRESIDSVLNQTRRPDEIIVVDDGSTDCTSEVLSDYRGEIIYLRQEHAGASQARNRGIQSAQSRWIAFLDADDFFEPTKIEEQIKLLERNPELVWCYGNYWVFSEEQEKKTLSHNIDKAQILLGGQDYFENCLEAYAEGFPTSSITLLIRKDVLLEAGMFDVSLSWGQDVDLVFRIAYRYPKIGYLRQPLSWNRFRRPGSITETHRYRVRERSDFLKRHLELSACYGYEAAYRRCASCLLKRWLRQLFEGAAPNEILTMVQEFQNLIPMSLRAEAWLRCRFPRTMSPVIDWYFKVKDRLRKGRSNGI